MRHVLTLPLMLLALIVLAEPVVVGAQPSEGGKPAGVENPGTDFWRYVRQRPGEISALKEGVADGKVTTQIRGVDTATLINQEGETWRLFRADKLIPYSAYLLIGSLGLILLIYLLIGVMEVRSGDSGKRLLRFATYERSLHWFMAALFLFLGITGLLLLFGRPVLLPVIGKQAFSVLASASKEGHNLLGPVFLLSLLLFAWHFWRKNIYEKGDATWLIKGGGFIGKAHPDAGFFNMGEKVLFWLVVLIGMALSVAGLVLLFPNFGQGRQIMAVAHLIHALGAVILLVVIIGHIYMAITVKGTIDGMNRGYVELNWAKMHHSRWAEEKAGTGELFTREEAIRLQGGVLPSIEAEPVPGEEGRP